GSHCTLIKKGEKGVPHSSVPSRPSGSIAVWRSDRTRFWLLHLPRGDLEVLFGLAVLHVDLVAGLAGDEIGRFMPGDDVQLRPGRYALDLEVAVLIRDGDVRMIDGPHLGSHPPVDAAAEGDDFLGSFDVQRLLRTRGEGLVHTLGA